MGVGQKDGQELGEVEVTLIAVVKLHESHTWTRKRQPKRITNLRNMKPHPNLNIKTIYEAPCFLHRQKFSHYPTKPTNRRRNASYNSSNPPPTSFNKPTRKQSRLHTHPPDSSSQPKRRNKAHKDKPAGGEHAQSGQSHVNQGKQPMETQGNSLKSKIDISTRIIDRSSSSSVCNSICNRFAITSSPSFPHVKP